MAVIKKNKTEKGLSMVEILIVIAIIMVALTSLFGISGFSLKIMNSTNENTQANLYAQEITEAIKNFRDENPWDTGIKILTGIYHLEKSGTPPEWIMVVGADPPSPPTDIFTKQVLFENVMRDDVSYNIVANGCTGCTLDTNTKKATITVSWKGKTVGWVTFLTNWK